MKTINDAASEYGCIDIRNVKSILEVEVREETVKLNMQNNNGSGSLNAHAEDRYPSAKASVFSGSSIDGICEDKPLESGAAQMMFHFSDTVQIPVHVSTAGVPARSHRRKPVPDGQMSLFDLDNLTPAGTPIAALQNLIAPTAGPTEAFAAKAIVADECSTTLTPEIMGQIRYFVKKKIHKAPPHCPYDDLFQMAYIAYAKVEASFRKHDDPKRWPIGWEHKKFRNYVLRAIQNDIYDELQYGTTTLSTSSYYAKWHGVLCRESGAGMTEEEIAAKHKLTVSSVREILRASRGEVAFSEVFDEDDSDSSVSGVSSAASNLVRCAVAEADRDSRQDDAACTETVEAIRKAISMLNEDDRRILNYLLSTDFESGMAPKKKTVTTLAKEFGCTASEMKTRIAGAYANLRESIPMSVAKRIR